MLRLNIFLFTLVSFVCAVRGDFYVLDNSTLDFQLPVVRRVVAMYAPTDAPTLFQFGAGTGESYITFDITFETEPINGVKNPFTGSAEVVILQATDLNDVGFTVNGNVLSYCCTQAIINSNGCTQEGRLIVSNKAQSEGRYQSYLAKFDNKNTARLTTTYKPSIVSPLSDPGKKDITALDSTASAAGQKSEADLSQYVVKGTSEHILIVSFCDTSSNEIALNYYGTSTWVNPFGYLPGRLYGFLPFYGFMMIIYTFLAVLWFSWYYLYYSEVFPVQNAISAVLVMCLIESTFWFTDYMSFNYSGRRMLPLVLCAILLTVFRLTLSRMLVVAVSLGYGVARPSLGANKLRIIMLGVIYFGFEASLELVTRYAQTNEVAEHWRVILSLPVAVLNAIFYWWIFVALQRTHSELSTGGQAHKLAIYRQFTIVLVVSLVAAVCFAFYQIYFMTTHQFALHWANLWLLDGGFSVILYTVVLTTILFLWKPSKDSRRYAYSELPINQNDDDDDQFDSSLNDVEMQGTKHGPETAEHLDEDDDNPAPSNQPDSASQMFSIDDDKH